jgi:hypothetical protein
MLAAEQAADPGRIESVKFLQGLAYSIKEKQGRREPKLRKVSDDVILCRPPPSRVVWCPLTGSIRFAVQVASLHAAHDSASLRATRGC